MREKCSVRANHKKKGENKTVKIAATNYLAWAILFEAGATFRPARHEMTSAAGFLTTTRKQPKPIRVHRHQVHWACKTGQGRVACDEGKDVALQWRPARLRAGEKKKEFRGRPGRETSQRGSGHPKANRN